MTCLLTKRQIISVRPSHSVSKHFIVYRCWKFQPKKDATEGHTQPHEHTKNPGITTFPLYFRIRPRNSQFFKKRELFSHYCFPVSFYSNNSRQPNRPCTRQLSLWFSMGLRKWGWTSPMIILFKFISTLITCWGVGEESKSYFNKVSESVFLTFYLHKLIKSTV